MQQSHPSSLKSAPVLIIGAGIAGPALGIALARAGCEAIIYESGAAPRDNGGAFFNLAPNGNAVLRALEVERAIEDIGFRNDRLVFHNEDGRVLASTAVGGVTMMRGALSRALRETAQRRGVRIEFARTVAGVREQDGGVIVDFADGSSASGRAAVGADGIHSRTRASLFPRGPRPAYTGIVNLGGIVQTDLPPTGEAMHMVFGRRAFFGYAIRPSGEAYWFSNYAQHEEPPREAVDSLPTGVMRQRLLEVHRDDPPEVPYLLRAISGPVGAYPIYELPPLSGWHRGPVCLIGDAAHAIGPHVGQGVSLALEDAFVLAACLREHQDPGIAFAAFEQLRRPRVDPVVRQSRRTARQKMPAGWLGRKVRDIVLPTFLRQGAAAARELYQYALPALDPTPVRIPTDAAR